jgi:hypothetical protein
MQVSACLTCQSQCEGRMKHVSFKMRFCIEFNHEGPSDEMLVYLD